MILILAGVFVFALWAYILFIREWLVRTFPGGRVQWWHEQIEDKLWQKSRTMLVGRAYQIGGAIIALQTLAAQAGFDTTSILNEIAKFVPEQYRGLVVAVVLFLTGVAMVWLRQHTDTALEEPASSLDEAKG